MGDYTEKRRKQWEERKTNQIRTNGSNQENVTEYETKGITTTEEKPSLSYIEKRRQQWKRNQENPKLKRVGNDNLISGFVSYVNKQNEKKDTAQAELNQERAAMTDFRRQDREDTEKYLNDLVIQGIDIKPLKDSSAYLPFTDNWKRAKEKENEAVYQEALKRFQTDPEANRNAQTGQAMKHGLSDQPYLGNEVNYFLRSDNTYYMTQEERDLYNYILSTDGEKNAKAYLDRMKEELDSRAAGEWKEAAKNIGEQMPGRAVAYDAFLSTAASPTGFLYALAQKGLGNETDTDSPYFAGSYMEESVREGIKENKLPLVSKGASDFLIDTGLSMTQNLARLPLGSAGLAIAAGGAATGAYLDAKERGASENQALLSGAAQGAAEAFFEKFSLENLKALKAAPPKTAREFLMNILKQSVTEGSEEVATEFANAMSDWAIMKEMSQISQDYESYISENYSDTTARKKTITNLLQRMGMAGLGGALSGGVMGAGAQALGTWTSGKSSSVENYQEYADAIETEKSAFESEEQYKAAQEVRNQALELAKKQQAGEPISDMEKGYFENATDELARMAAPETTVEPVTEKNNEAEESTPEVQKPDSGLQGDPQSQENGSQEVQGTEGEELGIWSEKYGKNGREAFEKAYDGSMEMDGYYKAFSRYYNAGRYNMEMDAAAKSAYSALMTPQQAAAAYKAGAQDRNLEIGYNPETYQMRNMTQGEKKTGGLGEFAEGATEAQKKVAQAIGKRTGLQIELVDNIGTDGAVASYQKGVVKISINSRNFNSSMSHELTHFIQEYSPDMYQLYQDKAVRAITQADGVDLEELIGRYMDNYEKAGQELSRAEALDEIAADATERFFNDPEFIDQIVKENRTLGEKILDFIEDMIDAIKSLMKDGSTKQAAKALEQNLQMYESARTFWFQGLQEAGDRYQDGWEKSGNGEKYQLVGVDENGIEIYELNSSSKDLTMKQRKKLLLDSVLNEYRGRTAKFSKDGKIYYAVMDNKGIRKGIYGDKKSDKSGYRAKINIGVDGNYFELVENSKYDNSSDEQGKVTANRAHSDVKSWDYYQKTIISDGVKYNVLINVRDTGNEQYVYDVTLKRTKEQDSSAAQPKLALGPRNPVNNSIADDAEKINTRFQLEDPIEETTNLIAVHNLTSDKLLKTLEYDGIPMPSIAITKADLGHEDFGDISLLFRKPTVDPQNKKNKVYSADAWTPEFPKIEYEADRKVIDRFSKMVRDHVLPEKYGREAHMIASNLEDYLNIYGDEKQVIERIEKEPAVKALYLASHGNPVNEITKEVREGKEKNQVMENIIGVFQEDLDTIKKMPLSVLYEKYSGELKEAIIASGRTEEQANKMLAKKGGVLGGFSKTISRALRYADKPELTVHTVTDYQAMEQKMDDQIDVDDYQRWIGSLLDGLWKDSGVPNGKEIFDRSGNRKTFKQTHYPVTAANIVKAMMAQGKNAKNVSGFHGIKTIRAETAKEFKSLDEIRSASGKITNIDNETYERKLDGLQMRLDTVMRGILDQSRVGGNEFINLDYIGECILEACENPTASNIESVLNRYNWNTTMEQAEEIASIIQDTQNMPVNMFEAKPQRVVGYDEVAAAVVPDDISESVLQALDEKGIRTLTYDPEVKGSRKDVVNSVEGIRFQLEDIEDILEIMQENEELKEANVLLEKQFKLTSKDQMRQDDIKKFAGEVLSKYHSEFNRQSLTRDLTNLYEYIRSSEQADPKELSSVAADIGRAIIKKSVTKDTALADQYKDTRKKIRDTKIFISDQDKADLADVGGYNEFRKKYFGRMKLGKDGISIDSLYEELAGEHPEFFDLDITHPADRLVKVGIFLDVTQPKIENPYHANLEEMSYIVGQELLSGYWDIRQPAPTFADRKQAELIKVRQEYNKKIQNFKDKTVNQYEALLAEKEREIGRIKDQHERELVVQKEKYDQKLQQRRDSQRKKEAKARIIKEVTSMQKWLLEPTDTKHVPQSLKGAVADFLSNVDFSSKDDYSGVVTQRTQAWNEALKAFQNIKESSGIVTDDEGNMVFVDLDPDMTNRINELSDKVKGIEKLEDLDAYSLEELQKVVVTMRKTITEINQMKGNKRYRQTSILAEDIFKETESVKDMVEYTGIVGKGSELLKYDMLDPQTMFGKIGPAFKTTYDALRVGLDRKTVLLKEAEDYFDSALKESGISRKEIRKWTGTDAPTHTFDVGENKIEMSIPQIMSLYELDKRGQARKHLYDRNGGIKPGELKRGISWDNRKIDVPHKKQSYSPVRVNRELVRQMTDVLTPEQKSMADALQKFMGEHISKWGNETSMEMYGYEKFTANDYFPIMTDKNRIIQQEGEDKGKAIIKNLGFTKGTNKHANNSIVIEDIFDVFTRQVDQMSSYNAYVIPLSDLHKVMNYKDMRGFNDSSIKEQIKRAFGDEGISYINKLIDDINGSIWSDSSISEKLMSNMKSASVGLNLRVAIQQPTAIARAAAEINAKYLVQATLTPETGKWDIITRYAPIAQWKDWGFYQMKTARSMKDVLIGSDSLKQRLVNKSMFLAELGDKIAWERLWIACELETVKKYNTLEKGSEEFYRKVGDRFSEIVDRTQVADSVLHRTQIMRSKNGLTKMATSFMAEPLKSYNMMYRAMVDVKRKQPGSVKRLAAASASYVASAFFTAAAASVIDATRDDDRDKNWTEKYTENFWGNVKDNANILYNIPFVKDAISTFQGYTVKRTDMQGFQDIYYAWNKLIKLRKGEGMYTAPYVFLEMARSVSNATGIAIKSLTRDAIAIIDTAMQAAGGEVDYEWMKKKYDIKLKDNRKRYVSMMMQAEDFGNGELAEKIKSDLIETGLTEDEILEKVNDILNERFKSMVDFDSLIERYDAGSQTSRNEFQEAVDLYISLKERAGWDKKKCLQQIRAKLTNEYKPQYKEAKTTAERDAIIKKAKSFYYDGNSIYKGYDFKANWKDE